MSTSAPSASGSSWRPTTRACRSAACTSRARGRSPLHCAGPSATTRGRGRSSCRSRRGTTRSANFPAMPVVVTRRETFTAGHRLFRPEWSDERNREVFGQCSNPSGHGHNYVLEVSVRGEIDPETGYVMDLADLSRVLHESVLDDVDHRNLNT